MGSATEISYAATSDQACRSTRSRDKWIQESCLIAKQLQLGANHKRFLGFGVTEREIEKHGNDS